MFWQDGRITVGTVESQSDVKNEPTIAPEAVDLWERTVLRCDYLFSNAGSVKRSLQREYNLPSEIVPTGVDSGFFTPAWTVAANHRLRVLFVGSLRPFKQPQLVLQAAARFSEADFVLAGEGLMADELKTRVERERLGNVQAGRPAGGGRIEAAVSASRNFSVSIHLGRVPKLSCWRPRRAACP